MEIQEWQIECAVKPKFTVAKREDIEVEKDDFEISDSIPTRRCTGAGIVSKKEVICITGRPGEL